MLAYLPSIFIPEDKYKGYFEAIAQRNNPMELSGAVIRSKPNSSAANRSDCTSIRKAIRQKTKEIYTEVVSPLQKSDNSTCQTKAGHAEPNCLSNNTYT